MPLTGFQAIVLLAACHNPAAGTGARVPAPAPLSSGVCSTGPLVAGLYLLICGGVWLAVIAFYRYQIVAIQNLQGQVSILQTGPLLRRMAIFFYIQACNPVFQSEKLTLTLFKPGTQAEPKATVLIAAALDRSGRRIVNWCTTVAMMRLGGENDDDLKRSGPIYGILLALVPQIGALVLSVMYKGVTSFFESLFVASAIAALVLLVSLSAALWAYMVWERERYFATCWNLARDCGPFEFLHKPATLSPGACVSIFSLWHGKSEHPNSLKREAYEEGGKAKSWVNSALFQNLPAPVTGFVVGLCTLLIMVYLLIQRCAVTAALGSWLSSYFLTFGAPGASVLTQVYPAICLWLGSTHYIRAVKHQDVINSVSDLRLSTNLSINSRRTRTLPHGTKIKYYCGFYLIAPKELLERAVSIVDKKLLGNAQHRQAPAFAGLPLTESPLNEASTFVFATFVDSGRNLEHKPNLSVDIEDLDRMESKAQ